MRIARPKAPETQFRRKRAPPPQATKLLRASLAAGLIFIVLLAIVFIPRGLQYGDQTVYTILDLRLETPGGGPRWVVASATFVFNVSLFRATLLRDNVTIASLGPGLTAGGATLNYVDNNTNQNLDAGDYFTFTASVDGRYRFEIHQAPGDHLVGVEEWTGHA